MLTIADPVLKKVRLGNPRNELEARLDSREVMINGARNWLSFPVTEKDGKLLISRVDLAKTLEPQLRPQMIQNMGKVQTVVLDAGHGGYDKGACSNYGCEKDFTLDVARQLRPLLKAQGIQSRDDARERRFRSAGFARPHRECATGFHLRQHPFQRDRPESGRDRFRNLFAHAGGLALVAG